MKEEDDEEKIFWAAADIASTFPINNEIISSEIRRVMSAIKIDPRCGYAQVRPRVCVAGQTNGCSRAYTHQSE